MTFLRQNTAAARHHRQKYSRAYGNISIIAQQEEKINQNGAKSA
jgi:hypothetical protein